MRYYIGIDLGTSAMKMLLMDETGVILNTVTQAYPLHFRSPAGVSSSRRTGAMRCSSACRN